MTWMNIVKKILYRQFRKCRQKKMKIIYKPKITTLCTRKYYLCLIPEEYMATGRNPTFHLILMLMY